MDQKAFAFLKGLFESIPNVSINEEALYNGINGKGVMIYGPVEQAI